MKIRNNSNKKFELNSKELNTVVGGTFTPNTYSQSGYHTFGISTSYHVYAKDEFKFMGKKITYSQANEIMKLGNKVMNMLNSGFTGNDRITASEPAFIRAFNMELKLLMPELGLWDGKAGCKF